MEGVDEMATLQPTGGPEGAAAQMTNDSDDDQRFSCIESIFLFSHFASTNFNSLE